jgi:hypothetical protein
MDGGAWMFFQLRFFPYFERRRNQPEHIGVVSGSQEFRMEQRDAKSGQGYYRRIKAEDEAYGRFAN